MNADGSSLPRWRGFNLQAKFMADDEERFREEDFEWMAEWGFDFARLPMDYRCWTGDGWLDFDEDALEEIDEAVEYGREHGVHVNLNFHRGPGFTVADPPEETDLWTDSETRDVFAEHWRRFAERYEGISSEEVSFDLINEPAETSHGAYADVVRDTVEAIHEVDPDRLVVADGMRYGREPVFELADTECAQSTRGYDPFPLTHHEAEWTDVNLDEPPTWPYLDGAGKVHDREWLRATRIAQWERLESMGVGVHVGEWGVYNHTPHDVTLSWMEDALSLWEEAGWGWALWNFRGPFGVLDSERSDVDYEDWHGHDLDREMLELLREY
ncbi:glycoside hydrolase family protein [Halosimplex carlsbadense 2-9-1]|uniref:Glycoside hydrolase family protein n=1 Tax=Halosimplex carlsbadense 2-9-1 TaxID=797114 RepID=M0CW63_9EURY|nr:cellulase family glycosylhydrolase [Halosimplex carlsbadense]ELZ26888.1 glycoside hydrolase family protein [Halosimplex carlsbadense 2-9-1]